tara:strand:- start:8 stop:1771 length:1764 start_codon:yes stop_codon:yes gene_type:complete
MKILRLLNKKNFFIFFFLFSALNSNAEDQPIDIWNIEKKELKVESVSENSIINLEDKNKISDIYSMQSQNDSILIEQDEKLISKNIKITGLYDPEEFGLDMNMWSNSDGDQLKNIFSKLNKIKLSKDAAELMNISMLTNSYYPNKNISEKEFLKIRSSWLIKSANLKLIEEYLSKNQIINMHPKLTKYLVNQHLVNANLKQACDIFSKNIEPLNDEYLSKFNIYCLIKLDKKEEAQLILDLKKELSFSDEYFEKKISFLLGYTSTIDEVISEESILDFHLAHQTNPNFIFEPKKTTDKLIWKYLASYNLLNTFKEIDILEIDKVSTLEKATNDKNYPEKELFELYKRFQFSINQLLNIKESSKSLSNIEGRALVYQRILLESEMTEKLKLLKILKNSFKKDNLDNAFDLELKNFLVEIDPTEIPDNLTSFYYTNVELDKNEDKKIKYNKDVLHQSKLINYFNGDYSKSKIEKDLENYLKKIRKDKKYFFSKKDQIFLETLKSDGIEIPKKYDDLYEVNEFEIPTDIQIMINNNEKGAALLRIVEVIGQDKLEKIDEDTIYFIISTLNQLNINVIRNNILLKVLPLKV